MCVVEFLLCKSLTQLLPHLLGHQRPAGLCADVLYSRCLEEESSV